MSRSPASRWMRTANYGRPIASRSARYAARYYRIIIAGLVVLLLVVEAARVSVDEIRAVTAISVILYAVYVIVRLALPTRWRARYYSRRVQFWRAQAGALGLTILLAAYAACQESNYLWLLYLLTVMIVGEHCSTPQLLLTLIETNLFVIGLGYLEYRGPLLAYFGEGLQSGFATAAVRAMVINLFGFLLHYLVRNVGARDTTIARYREMVDMLARDTRLLHDPQEARVVVLRICQTIRNADCCSLWALDPQGTRLSLIACTADDGSPHGDCPANGNEPHTFSIALDDERLPARVAQIGMPHFASQADNPPIRVADALPSSQPFLPHARLEIGLPIPDFRPHQPNSLAVLCIAFERSLKHEEMVQEYDAACEMARYLSPILYHSSLLEQYQALQGLAQMVTHSLDSDRVLDTLLELVTGVFGFDFATVSLVDEVEGVIRTVRGRNVPDEWIAASVHSLNSSDIQADIIRTGRTEVLTGWDERFDREIWEQFGHRDMVRVFLPLVVADPATGQEQRIGTLEAGYRKGERERIADGQVQLLHPFVDQAAVAVTKAHLYEQMRATANALTALHHGGQAIQSAVWQPRRLLEQIGRSAEQVLHADIVLLFSYDEDRGRAELLFIGGDVRGSRKWTR